jgi:uncharacterized membrane protein
MTLVLRIGLFLISIKELLRASELLIVEPLEKFEEKEAKKLRKKDRRESIKEMSATITEQAPLIGKEIENDPALIK